MPLLGFAEFRNQQDSCCQQTFCSVIEVGVLSEIRGAGAREDNGLGNDLCVLLGLSLVVKLLRIIQIQIHVLVDQV